MTGFLGSGVMERAIGASFVYLLIAAFCSTVNEWLAALLNARAATLEATIQELLKHQNSADGMPFIAAFYAHPIITAMMDNGRHPSYLPPRSFVTAVLDLATPGIQGPISFAGLQTSLRALPSGGVRTSLLALIQNVEGDMDRAESKIEGWFNDAMSRASDSYKQRTVLWTALIAATLTIALNADSVEMLRKPGFPGWSGQGATHAASALQWMSRITGWSVTVAAVSLGAPFWFVVLKRLLKPRAV